MLTFQASTNIYVVEAIVLLLVLFLIAGWTIWVCWRMLREHELVHDDQQVLR